MYLVYYIFYYHFEIYVYLFKKQGEDGGNGRITLTGDGRGRVIQKKREMGGI